MPRIGRHTWKFEHPAYVVSTGTVAGSTESQGPLGGTFDVRIQDDYYGQSSWERAEQKLFEHAVKIAMDKGHCSDAAVDLCIGGDLNAQLTGFFFGLRPFHIPSLGVYSACATITEALAIAAMALDSGFAETVLAGSSSHNGSAERQFRFPTEYGVQKPPSAQRTVTGAGAILLSRKPTQAIRITHATIGEVVDMGVKSPWEMGAAMAPAAFHTIENHLTESGFTLSDFDCIATGDLGKIGHAMVREMLDDAAIPTDSRLTDCGVLIYDFNQPEVFSGGSGGACCSLVTFGHLLNQLASGLWTRLLVCATGALLSTVTVGQSESIPGICHAVVFERV